MGETVTFDDDFVRLHMEIGTYDLLMRKIGLSWPPPERLAMLGEGVREAREGDPADAVMVRMRMSEISDSQRFDMTHVARGAEYVYEDKS